MSIFGKKSKFQIKTEVRIVKQAVDPAAQGNAAGASKAASEAASNGGPQASRNGSAGQVTRLQATSTSATPERRRFPSSSLLEPGRKRRTPASASSRSPAAIASPALSDSEPGSDDDDDWRERLDPTKRRKRTHTSTEVDPNRRVLHPKIWSGQGQGEAGHDDGDRLGIVHSADVASLRDKCQPVMSLAQDDVGVSLRYPGANFLERYELVWGKDKIDGALDIMKVVKLVATIYLTDEEAKPFLDHDSGICRRLEKSKNTNDGNGFKAAVQDFNNLLLALQKKGVIAKHVGSLRIVPQELVDFILDQVYDRTVAPRVELLAKYENGSDNVYGELLHPFISDIFERTKLTSDMVFVDLGSGVGNVVLQAALERGCESWGCEMMENACNLAEAQKKEFTARCRLWGIAPGEVHLERGDFRRSEKTLEALKRADVVLVNNQAFTSQLNDHLVNMFLDLKIGCKIVSLKTFVHDNKIAENDVASSILEVEHLTYPEDYVSWTNAPGTFCISTRK
ncbi:histone H3-K79 methyltransferase-like protein [Chaetomium strumarium]|uniref:Histone-lysine N-methyltransferase, H3 lysine-79 specific n=1 Tax=Chaetomium strumarium TaxID=1170767 RepID=A0AAJ0GLS5_9PEZI|nr:histone H3-K79 methyltransferase-like protein [Chaetomium strumarium]